eukprot:scaffold159144_cov25-Tisochrysis_lutea.AAC.4
MRAPRGAGMRRKYEGRNAYRRGVPSQAGDARIGAQPEEPGAAVPDPDRVVIRARPNVHAKHDHRAHSAAVPCKLLLEGGGRRIKHRELEVGAARYD